MKLTDSWKRDGKLQAHIGPDMELDEVTKKLEVLFQPELSQSRSTETSAASEPIAANSTSQPPSTTESATSQNHNLDSTPAPTSSSNAPATAENAPTSSSSAPPHVNPSPSTSKGKGKARAADHELSPPDTSLPSTAPPPRSASQLDWIEKQRQRQIEAKRERERIMAQIEADKVERRAKRLADKEAHSAHPPTTPSSPPPHHSSSSSAAQTHLSIRLLDGSTHRTTLPSTATLATHLRPLLTSTHPDLHTTAYTFKHLVPPPAPAQPIETPDEHRPLSELGLAPSAALVLVPVPHAAAAYERGAALALPWEWLGGVVGAARAAVGGVAGWFGAAAENPAGDVDGGGTDGRARGAANVRTLADRRDDGGGSKEESNRWYNGNQLSFQGRDEDDWDGRT